MGLDSIQLILAVEEEFGIRVQDEEASKMITVGDLFAHILSQCESEGKALDRAIAWTRYVSVVVEELGVPESLVIPEAEFVGDLRMD